MTKRYGLWVVMAALALLASACASDGTAAGTATQVPVATEAATSIVAEAGSEAATPVEEAGTGATTEAAPMETAPATAEATAEMTATVEVTATAVMTATEAPTVEATATQSAGYATNLNGVGVRLEPLVEGLTAPVWVTHAGDDSGRMFVLEKRGTVRIIQDGQLLPEPFLDIEDRVGSSSSEQGLLGLAFAPDYIGSGYFFVNYTNKDGDTVISRFQVTGDANVADPASEFKVLGLDQPAANHNGGDLVFGPDGYLWIGTGDGGGANDRFGNGQNPATLFGKMLRLDVTSDPAQPYVVPPDNPWVNADWNGQDVANEVWAVGLRNPWRYSFDPATGDLWIADVGQNAYEEVHRVPAGSGGGLNFGWPIMEGLHCFQDPRCDQAGLELPVAEFSHGPDGCSITGGYVYRGTAFPALAGAYLFSDFCSGKIWGLQQDGDAWASVELADTNLSVSSFGEDQAGELYVTDLAGGGVYHVVVE